MENPQVPEESGSDLLKFDKRILFLTIKRKILFICIVAFIAMIIGGIFAKFTVENSWKAECILIRHKKNLAAKTDVPYLYQEMDYNTILQSIKMRKNLQAVIDSLKLDTAPENIYGAFKVSRGSRSNLISIKATSKDRNTAVNMANMLGEIFIYNYIKILNSSTIKIYDYYKAQRNVYEDRLITIQDSLQNFRDTNKILSLEKETQNQYDNLKVLELELMNTDMNVTSLKTKITDIAERIKDLPEKVELTSTVSATQKKDLAAKKNELTLLKKKYTEKNPKIVKLKSEIKALEKDIETKSDEEIIPDQTTYGKNEFRQSLLLEKTQYENEVIASEKKIGEYRKKIASIKEQLKSLSPLEREYYDIKNNEATIREQLKKIKNRLVETKIAMDSNLSDFEVLEKAVAPKYPEASGKKMIVIVFGFLAFIGLFLLFAGKEFLDFSIKSDFDFQEILKIKLLGEIPNKDSVPPPIFYSQIQIMYGQLNSLLPDKKPAVITIGNDVPETGSTFIIQELSELMISQNKKILWIESIDETSDDITQFEINRFLYNAKSLAQKNINIITDQLHKAYFLCDENTFKRVLDFKQLNEFFSQFQSYDIIIWELFDVHFNLHLFTTIASSSDMLAFVARFRHSNRTQLSNAVEFLKDNTTIPIVGILNDIKKPYFKLKI